MKKPLSKIFKELGIDFVFPIEIKDSKGNLTYYENSDGYWRRREYDEQGNQTYYENSNGYWIRREYDERGKQTYYENSNGYWRRREYNERGDMTYYENHNGYWIRYEYDKQGNETYSEDRFGYRSGTPRNSCATLDSSNEVLRITVTGAVPVKIILELV